MKFTLKETAIKNLLGDELQKGVSELTTRGASIIGGWQDNFIAWAKSKAIEELEKCETYEDLDDYVLNMYRMDLREWVESL